ncbi:MAG: hypothetical protein Q8Q42_04625 [Nanoarchaeota archaeon]|nr:hypothetical protein [Nanoarchaeota archaeon]
MIGLNLADIISQIKDKAGLSDEEIKIKISQKKDRLSGLISDEGAAHILANELGIDLMESIRKHGLKIEKLQSGMRVGVTGKVVKMYEVRSFNKNGREGRVGSFLVGDDTGLIRIVLWDENHILKMENGDIKEGVVMKIENGNVKENNGYKEMHLGNYSTIELNPSGVEIVIIQRTEPQNFSGSVNEITKLSDANAGDNISIYGTIVQLFDPRAYDGCSECGRKAVDGKCNNHPGAAINKIPILNFFVDDGYGGMRGVAFRDQAANILGLSEKEIQMILDNPVKFQEVKTKALGMQKVLSGRVNSNEMYNRNEFMVRSVHEMDAKEVLAKFLN